MMNNKVREALIKVARSKKVIYYQELCNYCGLKFDMFNNPNDRREIGKILGDISIYEFDEGRPLLSALVISRNGEEGDGFYKLCEFLGITKSWKKLKNDGVFAVQEISKCHEYWANK